MIIQVIRVEDYSSYELALRRSMFVDFLLLDSGKPYKKNKTLGGTGNIHEYFLFHRVFCFSYMAFHYRVIKNQQT